jgi:hypothetical protein
MEKQQSVEGLALILMASLARDLDTASLLSGTSRKALHDGFAELEAEISSIPGASAAVTIVHNIPPAGSD